MILPSIRTTRVPHVYFSIQKSNKRDIFVNEVKFKGMRYYVLKFGGENIKAYNLE